ncbi:MAG: glycosyltransferase family 4 protein [Faecousia sp.]
MRVLFITNYASPYRVCFYDELAKYMDVTVLFSDRIEDKKHRSADWFISGEGRFHGVQLEKRVASVGGRDLCLDVIQWLKQPWDAIVVCGYAYPTTVLAMLYMRLHGIPFYMEVDGGLIRESSGPKYWFKRCLVSQATVWISSGHCTTDYLVHYGAKAESVFQYPFTSLWEREIPAAVPAPPEKQSLREKLAMSEKKIVLYVGRFDPKKGMDDLLRVTPEVDREAGIYFIGGEPTEEHLAFCRENNLEHVHFVGFQKKEALQSYYRAADLLVLPTHSDVWGLVINEAMAQGLPIVTTDKCVAGMELVENGVNGYLVPVKDDHALATAVNQVLASDYRAMGEASLEKIRPYTIENMAKAHVEILS